MTGFWKAFLWTTIPIVALSILSTAGAAAEGFYWAWFVAVGLGVAGILAAVGFAIAKKKRAAAGIVNGIALGILALAVTCYANLESISIIF